MNLVYRGHPGSSLRALNYLNTLNIPYFPHESLLLHVCTVYQNIMNILKISSKHYSEHLEHPLLQSLLFHVSVRALIRKVP